MGNILRTIIGVIKENTRSLHYSSYGGGSMGPFKKKKKGPLGIHLRKRDPNPKGNLLFEHFGKRFRVRVNSYLVRNMFLV